MRQLLVFKLLCEIFLADVTPQFLNREISALIYLVMVGLGDDVVISYDAEGGDKFAFAARLPDVLEEETAVIGHNVQAKFLARLADNGIGQRLAIIDMTANGSIPLAGSDILLHRPFLQIQSAIGIEHMQMHHGMQCHRAAMTIFPRSATYYATFFINKGEQLLLLPLVIV